MVANNTIPLLDPPEEKVGVHRLCRREFRGLLHAGVIDEGCGVELLDGVIVDLQMQTPAHSVSCELAQGAFHNLGEGMHIRSQKPLALEEFSEPEPDVVIVAGAVRDYAVEHPTPDAVKLLIEVSDSSLSKDRGRKLRAYARGGIREYWIVNLADRRLEVYRAPSGETYAESCFLSGDETAVADEIPGIVMRAGDLFA